MSVTIAIVADRSLRAAGLKALIARTPNLEIVGEAATLDEAYQLIRARRPDVIVASGVDALGLTRELAGAGARVLLVWPDGRASRLADALSAGAMGYVSAAEPVDALIGAIGDVANGRTRIPPPDLLRRSDGRDHPFSGLSKREQEVLGLLVSGLDNGQVARILYISQKTIETHRSHIYRKLGVHSLAELVRSAYRAGLMAGEMNDEISAAVRNDSSVESHK